MREVAVKPMIHAFNPPSYSSIEPEFKIVVRHIVGMELAVEEEGRRMAIKVRQRKNKRNKRRKK